MTRIADDRGGSIDRRADSMTSPTTRYESRGRRKYQIITKTGKKQREKVRCDPHTRRKARRQ
jgi:hypothetical protein